MKINLIKIILIALIVIFISPVHSAEASSQPPIRAGMIVNNSDDIIWQKISITNPNREIEGFEFFYEGDIIYSPNIERITVRLEPGFVLEKIPATNQVRVVFRANTTNIFHEIWNYFNLGYYYTLSVPIGSKGDDNFNYNPKPGDYISVLSQYPIKFTWNKDNKPTAIIFADKEQKVICKKDISDSIEISLDTINE